MNHDLLQQVIGLIKAGKKETAGKLLANIVKNNPEDEMAWLYLSDCVRTNDQKQYCFKKVLEINPNNQSASNGIIKLLDQDNKVPASSVTDQTSFPKRSNRKQKSKGLEKAVIGGLSSILVCIVLLAVFMFANQSKLFEELSLVSPSGILPLVLTSNTPSKTIIIESAKATFTPSPVSTNRPTFTPYPTNTIFVLSTWTSTNSPPTQTPTQIPTQNPTQNPTSITNPTAVKGKKPSPTTGSIPTQRIIPSKTPKPNISVSCSVSPNIIQVGANTTLTIFAQLYVDGKASSTSALVAEWQDSQGRPFHCSGGNSCKGQSGYFAGNSPRAVISIGVNSANGSRINCQTTFGTH